MKLKKILLFGLMVCTAVLMAGCVQREIVVNPEDTIPDMIIKDDIVIDWNQVMDDCQSMLNHDDYPYGVNLSFSVNEAQGEDPAYTEIIWTVSPECSGADAQDYAAAFAKTFNDAIATQDFSYALSSDDSYGGYWDKNNMLVQVFYEKDVLNPENYIVNQFIEAGTNDPMFAIVQGQSADGQ